MTNTAPSISSDKTALVSNTSKDNLNPLQPTLPGTALSTVSPERKTNLNPTSSPPGQEFYTQTLLSPSSPLGKRSQEDQSDSEPISPFTPSFLRPSPKVTPYTGSKVFGSTSNFSCRVTSPPRASSLPPPKFSMSSQEDRGNQLIQIKKDDHSISVSAPSVEGQGVEMVLKASARGDRIRYDYSQSQKLENSGKNTSPPRDQRNPQAKVVSPPDTEVPRRGSLTQQGYDVCNDSPHQYQPSSYHGPPHGYYPPPPQGFYHPHPTHRSSNPSPGEDSVGEQYQHPHAYYPPPYGYGYDRYYSEDAYREASHAPDKRYRGNDGDHMRGQPVSDREREEGTQQYKQNNMRPYYERPPPYNHGVYNPSASDSFDSNERSDSGSKRSPRRSRSYPPVAKSSSYPPPPSPPSGRYGPGGHGDSSAASYPGARRSRGPHIEGVNGSDDNYDSTALYSRAPPSHYNGPEPRYYPGPHSRYEEAPHVPTHEGFYREPRSHPPPGFYEVGPPDQYPRHGQNVHQDDIHPLLRDNNRHPIGPEDERTHHSDSSPSRSKHTKNQGSITSKDISSPNKPKPSTTAKAAIAAGMTEPASAKEVEFNINNPPAEPFTHPSTSPICSQSAEINIHDVLCGRGGGTNTQIGNRRFRSLVQEFQPTYLLCRRKEKPLIARTIVLIIRNRGGRFLKKNENEGSFYEVGDEKAEAKTSQALREGLDVRASRSTMDGRKKQSRSRKKKADEIRKSPVKTSCRLEDISNEIESTPQRDGPPGGHHDGYPYPPPYYYSYGGDPYYPPYGAGPYPGPVQVPYSPSRKRMRGPPNTGEGAYEYQTYPPSPYKNYMYPPYPHDCQGHVPTQQGSQESGHDDENNMWEMDFSPPRTRVKKEETAGDLTQQREE